MQRHARETADHRRRPGRGGEGGGGFGATGLKVDGIARRTIWTTEGRDAVFVIDQRRLPHRWAVERLGSTAAVRTAIAQMWVRGAPLIGVAAAYGVALQCASDASDAGLDDAVSALNAARPTAVNLAWATRRMRTALAPLPVGQRRAAAWALADAMADEDVAVNSAIGDHGLELLRRVRRRRPGDRLNILTHCNAGWLATVDWGTALAPVYKAQAAGVDLHVWVDETRPRNQGAGLTAWELGQAGVPHTVIVDNAGGHLMQRGEVDAVIVGADRVGADGDVCNKIGTYLKALAARDNDVPFYVAMPLSTLDRSIDEGPSAIPIEQRAAREVTHVAGLDDAGVECEVCIVPQGTTVANPAFDVTPARLVTALVTERGVVPAERGALRAIMESTP
jgi:methylthioribose-1-phosphate isomerase